MGTDPVSAALSLRGSLEAALDDPISNSIGEFAAQDPQTVAPAFRPAQAALRRSCDIWAATGIAGELLTAGAALYYNPACDEYLGADLPQYNDEVQPGLPGGQCPGVIYNVTARAVTRLNGNQNSNVNVSGSGPGPLTRETGTQDLNPGTTAFDRIRDANGTQLFAAGISTGGTGEVEAELLDIVITTNDPGGDVCGSLPDSGPSFDPTRPGPPPAPNFDFQPDNGPPININIGAPTVNADGTFSLPVTIGDVDIDFGALTPGGPTAPDEPTPDYDNPSPQQDIDGGDGSPGSGEGLDEDVEGVACVLVDVVSAPANADREAGPPDFLYGDAGWVRFKSATAPFNTKPERIVNDNQICCVPPEIEAVGYQVKANVGYTLRVRHILFEA